MWLWARSLGCLLSLNVTIVVSVSCPMTAVKRLWMRDVIAGVPTALCFCVLGLKAFCNFPVILLSSGHINLVWLLDCQSLVATFCHGNRIVSLWSYHVCVITGVMASGLISWWRCSIAGSLASLVLRKIKIAWKSYVRDLIWAVQLEEWLCASVSEIEPRDCMVPDRRFKASRNAVPQNNAVPYTLQTDELEC